MEFNIIKLLANLWHFKENDNLDHENKKGDSPPVNEIKRGPVVFLDLVLTFKGFNSIYSSASTDMIWWEMPAARSCEESASLDSGRFGYRLTICFPDPVKILEKVRGIFIIIALTIFTVHE